MLSLSRQFSALFLIVSAANLSSCTTTPNGGAPGPSVENQTPETSTGENAITTIAAEPILTPRAAVTISAPPAPVSEPPVVPLHEARSEFDKLKNWRATDINGSFASFRKSCQSWKKANQNAMLNPNLPQYGRYSDWQDACVGAIIATDPHRFFEAHFTPVQQSTGAEKDGLLTGYYEPEIDVRIVPTAEFSEPILSRPESKAVQNLSRADLSARSSRIIAYGRAIDVFFLQVQGSGRLRYRDGTILRAAYAGNNGKKYKSIGKVLVARGELTLEQASKQAIEDWMARNGPAATRELMNNNPRYIFFEEQRIEGSEGPKGAMRVPLTAMSSIAVDPRYHPYGMPIWLQTTLPQKGGDFRGQKQSVLVMAQDTGSAIRGPLRGDLFFGSGKEPGERAGVMKHRATWTVFLPKELAQKNQASQTGSRS